MANYIEAIMAQAVKARDPEAALAKDYVAEDVQDMRDERILKRARGIAEIEALLNKANERNAQSSVIAAYDKLLNSLTS